MLRIWRCDCALCVIGNEFPCHQPHNPPPPSYEGSPHCPKDKNRSPFHGEKPLMIKYFLVKSRIKFPKRFCMVGTRYFESTENIRVFGGFLRARAFFWKKMTAIEAFSRFLGKRFFVWKLFELGACGGLLEAVWAFLRRLRFEVCFSHVFTGFWCRFS